nr:disease resistance protein tao1 [Quercus suber]
MARVLKLPRRRRALPFHRQTLHLAPQQSNEARAKLIQLLVKRVLEELDSTPLNVAPCIEELMSRLDVRSNGVRVLGLHGVGGVGKTTLAKALYNKLVGSFECLVFMKNDRENSETDDDLVYLQNKLINHLSPNKPPVYEVDSGISAIKDVVHEKQVLVILDDIRNSKPWIRTGTRCIEGIVLDLEGKPIVQDPSGERISRENLQRKPNFTSALTWTEVATMERSPLKALPSDFCPRELAVLDLSRSGIEKVWGSYTSKVAENLMVMNLSRCYNLAAIPDLSRNHALEKLILVGCKKLTKIHESLGNMSTLLHLNLRECSNLIEFPTDISGLKNLEILIFSDCSKLKELPNIGSMKSLKELLVDNTAIAKLPESIFRLTKLEKIDLNHCQLLRRLPNCIGKLSSLKELSPNDSAIEEIPDSVGSLSNLEILSLMWCGSVTAIPDSVGSLISLTQLLINGSAIKELPISIGSLSYLKELSVGNCKDLSKLPDSIEGLASLVELQLDRTPITHLPDQVGALKMLRKLEMRNCKDLRFLPESIGSMLALTTLNFVGANISELPESIGMLENLIILRLNNCTQLCKLPSSIGNLKSLHHLWMEETAVTELPESFGMLSSLMILKMAKKPYIELSGNSMPNSTEFPTSFSNLCLLVELNARAWKLCGKIPDDFAKLSSLESLNLGYNNFFSLPSSLTGLFNLKRLLLPYCKELKSLPPLPSNLEEVNVANCTALESVSDLSNLERLQELNLANCEKVVDIRGLECLKSLTRLSKVCLRNIRSLSMPGSKIPDWFSREVVRFSERKNLKIKGVIICVVVSLDLQIPDDLRDQLPIIAVGLPAAFAKVLCPIKRISYLQSISKETWSFQMIQRLKDLG